MYYRSQAVGCGITDTLASAEVPDLCEQFEYTLNSSMLKLNGRVRDTSPRE